MGAAIITSSDTPPVFEPSEHNLNLMPLFVESFAKLCRMAPSLARGNAGLNAFGDKSAAKLIAIVALVADQGFRALRQRRINKLGADVIACLPCCQAHDQRAPHTIDNSVKL